MFAYNTIVQCSTTIAVGARCAFGQAAMLVDGSHRFRDLDRPMLAQGYDFRPLRIGDDVMVSAKCTVIAHLGDRAFVAANSVVTRPVPALCLAAGLPATVRDYSGRPAASPTSSSPPPLSTGIRKFGWNPAAGSARTCGCL